MSGGRQGREGAERGGKGDEGERKEGRKMGKGDVNMWYSFVVQPVLVKRFFFPHVCLFPLAGGRVRPTTTFQSATPV